MSIGSAATLPGSNGWRPHMVALDVDGTIVRYDNSLSEAVADRISRVRDSDAHVVVATGRSLHATLPVCQRLGLTDGYAVTSNGAVIIDVSTGRVLDVVTFDASSTVTFFVDEIPDAVLAVEELGVGYRVTGEFPAGELSGKITVVPHDELLDGPVTRLVVRWPNGDRERLRALAAEAGLKGVDYAIGYTAWLDVMPSGVSKASALEQIRFRLDVPWSSTLAVGDGTNDLEMLRWAAHGVAMGQASDDVQAAADEVVPTVEEDGLAHVLERYFPSAAGQH